MAAMPPTLYRRGHTLSRRWPRLAGGTPAWSRPSRVRVPGDCTAALIPQSRSFFFNLFSGGRSTLGLTADICNCGADLGARIGRPDLVMREGMERGTQDWDMQFYGAAIYWHAAVTTGSGEVDVNLLRDCDVLEVGCMRGGGARYLAEVSGTRSFIAIDNDEVNIEASRQLHSPYPGLQFVLGDALLLDQTYPPESFDVILSVEFATLLGTEDMYRFLSAAKEVLRPGGFMVLSELLPRENLAMVVETIESLDLTIEHTTDMSKRVACCGRCPVSHARGDKYIRLFLRKQAEVLTEQGVQS